MSDFLAAADLEISRLKASLARNPDFIKLQELERVREVYVGLASTPSRVSQNFPAPLPHVAHASQSRQLLGWRDEALREVISYLTLKGAPAKTAELLDHLSDRGIVVPGKVPTNSVSSLLSKAEQVTSLGWHIGWTINSGDSVESAQPHEGLLPTDVEPFSAPVEPGGEVAHDNMK